MRSIFHITCDTPEELRNEVVAWLQREAEVYHAEAVAAKLQRDALAAENKRRAVLAAAAFWNEVIIDRSAAP